MIILLFFISVKFDFPLRLNYAFNYPLILINKQFLNLSMLDLNKLLLLLFALYKIFKTNNEYKSSKVIFVTCKT